jgi:perosamine synthetase
MIPVSIPWVTSEDVDRVSEAVRAGWISSVGPYVEQFEAAWAAKCGRKFGIAVTNGTTALELAVAALRLSPGDEVILPSFTIISCAQAITKAGGRPVLVDADPQTWCLDPKEVEKKITPRTRAIMPVHIYGHPADMRQLTRIADRHGLRMIEDAAEAHGAVISMDSGERVCGSFGDISCFSFYANKIVTTGEGGMLLTDDAEIAAWLRSARNLHFGKGQRYTHAEIGSNFRMTSMQAALGLSQLDRFDELLRRKYWLGRAYGERLAGISGLTLPVERDWARNVYWMYGVLLDAKHPLDADGLAAKLRALGIDTRAFFVGMHEQPALRALGLFAGESYPVTEHLSRKGLYLPSSLTLTEQDVDQVADALRKVLS